jgi:membrane protein DedA with SNARE-associated domain
MIASVQARVGPWIPILSFCRSVISLNLVPYIEAYGYWAMLAGGFLQGEIVLILGGFVAHRGYLDLPLVILMGLAGCLTADLFYFSLGRIRGRSLLEKRSSWKPQVARVQKLLESYDSLFIIGFRFLYGIRAISLIVLGTSKVKTVKFLFLNTLSASIYTALLGICGYVFGIAVAVLFRDIQRYETWVILAIALLATAFWIFHQRHKKGQ